MDDHQGENCDSKHKFYEVILDKNNMKNYFYQHLKIIPMKWQKEFFLWFPQF